MRLSQILNQLPNEQQYPFYRKVKAALRDGTLSAVPLTDSLNIYRANKPLTVHDHYLINTPEELQTWLDAAMQPSGKRATGAARYAVKDPEQLTPEELKRRADEYRASLSKTKPKRKVK